MLRGSKLSRAQVRRVNPCADDRLSSFGAEPGLFFRASDSPIIAGWAYQLVAEIGFARDTWVAPVDVRRVHPAEDENDIAAGQVRDLLVQLSGWSSAPSSARPLFVFDAGYDPVKLQK